MPPVMNVGGLEVIHPYTQSQMLQGPTEKPDETFTVIRIPGQSAQVMLTRAQIAALAGVCTGILDEERRRDIAAQAAQDAERGKSEHVKAREGLLGRLR
jgi:hypothetical protein